MTAVQLPEVPAPVDRVWADVRGQMSLVEPGDTYYTASQLREYATTDRANVLSAILAIIPGGSICDPQQIADDIRALLTPPEPNSDR